MFSLLKRLSTMPILLGSLTVSGLLLLLIYLKVPDKLAQAMGDAGEQTPFALDQHPYTPEATYKLLSDYGEAGRRATILLHLLFDLILPISYTLFFSSFFTLLGHSRANFPRLWRWAAVLPWLAGCFDAGYASFSRSARISFCLAGKMGVKNVMTPNPIMPEEKTPYILTGQQLHEVLERRLLKPGQVALLLDNGALTLMDSNKGAQFTLDTYAVYDLLDLLYQHKDWLHQITHQETQDKEHM